MDLRGVIHVHSTFSYDGKVTLTELRAQLTAAGYSFACMTEHTDELTLTKATEFVRECRALSDDTFVFIPGFEVPYQDAHVLHIGATDFISQTANRAQLTLWRKVAPLVILAHPVRNRFHIDAALSDVLDGIEIWNAQYDGARIPRQRSIALYSREAGKRTTPFLATGGIDYHRREHLTQPEVRLTVPVCSEETILQALKAGSFTVVGTSYETEALQPIQLTSRQRVQSFISVRVIAVGKRVQATLSRFGVRLPKVLIAKIRARV